MSPSADWELQVLVELEEACGGVSFGSTYPDDSQRIVPGTYVHTYVCRLKKRVKDLF